jgi:hypothetical protein
LPTLDAAWIQIAGRAPTLLKGRGDVVVTEDNNGFVIQQVNNDATDAASLAPFNQTSFKSIPCLITVCLPACLLNPLTFAVLPQAGCTVFVLFVFSRVVWSCLAVSMIESCDYQQN